MSWRAASGLRAWLLQRLSALYIAGFLLFLAFNWGHVSQDYASWRHWLGHGPVNAAVGVFFFALLVHAWVGTRDIIMDYVKPFSVRLILLICLGLGLIGTGLWALRILFSV